ncbi:uncharacterized protein LOC126832346 [Patella vulgata]|uniref:uncharacterized protein LOC126832346 n=1 Tax=Patella vulgata TaxID=6465 RepID=UPI0024A7F7BC|nr:uncharacterized protein LOC126832346 [Patella vulgata]
MARKRAHVGRSPKSNDNHPKKDQDVMLSQTTLSSLRFLLLLALMIGLCGFLFYPDISRLLKTLSSQRDTLIESGDPGLTESDQSSDLIKGDAEQDSEEGEEEEDEEEPEEEEEDEYDLHGLEDDPGDAENVLEKEKVAADLESAGEVQESTLEPEEGEIEEELRPGLKFEEVHSEHDPEHEEFFLEEDESNGHDSKPDEEKPPEDLMESELEAMQKETGELEVEVVDEFDESSLGQPGEVESGWKISGDESIIKFGGNGKESIVLTPEDIDGSTRKRPTQSKPKSSQSNDKPTKSQNSTPSKHNKSPKSNKGKPSSNKQSELKSSKSKRDVASKTKTDPNLPPDFKDFKASIVSTIDPKKTFIDGRRVPAVELLSQKPNNSSVKVYLFDEFLSEVEAEGLMRAHDNHVAQASLHDPFICFDSIKTLRKHLKDAQKKIRVTPNDFMEGTTCVNASFSLKLKKWFNGNWSYSTAFYPGESPFSTVLENRIHKAMGLPPSHGGKFQLTSYPVGKAYKTHTDCIVDGTDKRDRMASVLVYLNDVADGGKTEFPDLGIWVKPRKGRALLWNNMDKTGKCEPESRHEASVVKSGQKYILIRWYYHKNFYSLGKRPQEPVNPVRSEGQPRVSCDEYSQGSCRWYDEWGYDHLIEYERNKYTLM